MGLIMCTHKQRISKIMLYYMLGVEWLMPDEVTKRQGTVAHSLTPRSSDKDTEIRRDGGLSPGLRENQTAGAPEALDLALPACTPWPSLSSMKEGGVSRGRPAMFH